MFPQDDEVFCHDDDMFPQGDEVFFHDDDMFPQGDEVFFHGVEDHHEEDVFLVSSLATEENG